MTAISRIECLFDDLINYTENGQRRLIISFFENKVFSLFMECSWMKSFIHRLNLTNIYIPHNVQLVVFLSFNYDGNNRIYGDQLQPIFDIVFIRRRFSMKMCVNLSGKLTSFLRYDISDQVFSWEKERQIGKLEQTRKEKKLQVLSLNIEKLKTGKLNKSTHKHLF